VLRFIFRTHLKYKVMSYNRFWNEFYQIWKKGVRNATSYYILLDQYCWKRSNRQENFVKTPLGPQVFCCEMIRYLSAGRQRCSKATHTISAGKEMHRKKESNKFQQAPTICSIETGATVPLHSDAAASCMFAEVPVSMHSVGRREGGKMYISTFVR